MAKPDSIVAALVAKESLLKEERDGLAQRLAEVNSMLERVAIARATIEEVFAGDEVGECGDDTPPPTPLAIEVRAFLLKNDPTSASDIAEKIARKDQHPKKLRNAVYMTMLRRPQWFHKVGDGRFELTAEGRDWQPGSTAVSEPRRPKVIPYL